MGQSDMSASIPARLRKYPYPYRAMLSICSDLDETPDKETYFQIMKYLNTHEMTRIGKGVGLEVGNTIYFDMPGDQFSYWGTDDHGRELIHRAIRSGHIDCLHSYGDNATTRSQIERTLEALERHECRLEVWIDHAQAASNLDSQIMCGEGDRPGSAAYHADITWRHGVRFVWKGRVTSVIGQDVPRDFGGIFNPKHPLMSSKTISKEFLKGVLGRFGNKKYHMHTVNGILRHATLSGGYMVHEFIRSNPHFGGVSCGETAEGIPDVLTEEFLHELNRKGGACILYTHLGKIKDKEKIFNAGTRRAFERLSSHSQDKHMLVTTTRRLLGYFRTVNDLATEVVESRTEYVVKVRSRYEIHDLAGLTFYVPSNKCARLELNGLPFEELQLNERDEYGNKTVSIPWKRLPLFVPFNLA